MANLNVLDANEASKYLKGTGAGTDLDPFIPEHKETSGAAILAAVDGVEALLTTIDADTSALAAAAGTVAVSGGTVVATVASTTVTAGTVAISNATVAVTQSGIWNIGTVTALPNVVVGSGTVVATGPLTDTELRATPVPVSGTLTASISDVTVSAGTVVATGPLTDTELRATPIPVSGTLTASISDVTVSAGTVVATGPLTDTELRLTPVSVGGTVAATQSGTWNIGAVTALPNVVVGSGTIAATQSGTWNIGAVTTLPNVVVGSGTVVATVSGATIASGTITAQESRATLSHKAGTISASGDGTVLAAPGSGTTSALSVVQFQLEGAAAQTLLLKFGTVTVARALLQNQGDGIAYHFNPGREWRVGNNLPLVANLSGTPVVGYTIASWAEAV